MTMGLNEISAFDAINKLSETELKAVIKIFGDEKDAFRIAKKYCQTSKYKKIIK